MSSRSFGFFAGGVSCGLLFASPLLSLDSRLALPVRQPLRVDSFLVALPATVASANSLELRVIGEIERGDPFAFGDTDQDGRSEIIKLADSLLCSYRIFENRGNGTYVLEYSGACLTPFATGDLDKDGRMEIVGETPCCLQVYESLDAMSYPTELVWSYPLPGDYVNKGTISDTDRDGRMEIITTDNTVFSSVFLIFENRGDNAFVPVVSDTITNNGPCGNMAIADFDRDGLTEIAFSGAEGRLYVYESTVDDTWLRAWNASTGIRSAYAVSVGDDIDGDGQTELFLMGSSTVGTTGVCEATSDKNFVRTAWTTGVYEASSDNTFVRTATLAIDDGYGGTPHNAVVNLDDLGGQEYVMDTKAGLWIYRATAPAQWHLIAEVPDPGVNRAHGGVYGFDLNKNGRPEVVWAGYPTTLILEYRSGVSAVGENSPLRPAAISVFPNPCRLQAELLTPTNMGIATRLNVYDVAGRLVERRLLARDAGGRILWPVQHLASGVYMLRFESADGRALAAGRAMVAR